MAIVGVFILAFDGVGGNAVFADERGGDIILRGQGIGGAQHQVGAAGLQGEGQVGGFGSDMQAARHAYTL